MNAPRLIRCSFLRVFLSFVTGTGLLQGQQGMLSERWQSEVPMTGMDLFRKEINQRVPDFVSMTTSGLSFVDVAGHHGTRLRGRLVAPVTSDYTFFVAGDDQCELWLSPDGSPFNRELICWNQEFTSTLWNKLPSQRSRSIRLQQGQSYYIEGLMTNWGGSDYLALGWKRAPVAVFNENLWGGAGGTWTAAGDGLQFSAHTGDLSGVVDDALFRQREWTGKGEFIIKLSDLNNPDPSAKAGLMMRAHNGDNSRCGMVFKRPDGTTAFQYRLLDGESTATIDSPAIGEWLRLVKSANDLTASVSSDRMTWTTIGSATFASLPVTYLVGTAASSNTGPAGVAVTGKFSPLEALNLLPVETIPGSALVPYNGDPADLDDDSLPDAWETANGLDPTNGFGDEGAYSDPDGDSLTNQIEYHYGLTPKVANEIANTLLVERWNYPSGHSVEEFTTQTKFHDKPDSIVLAAPIDLKFPGVFFGSRIRGSITPVVSGNYTFWISARSSAEIWLSVDDVLGKYAKQRIASLSPATGAGHGIGAQEWNLFDRFSSQRSQVLHLEAGHSYHLEILHESSFAMDAHASVAWARDNGPREILPSGLVRSYTRSSDDMDDDCLPDAWETQRGLDPTDNGFRNMQREGERGDHDGDGLNNRSEYLLGTNPLAADTDGDGVSDYDEVKRFGTSPTSSNTVLSTVVDSPVLTNYNTAGTSGTWQMFDGGLIGSSFRGRIEWSFIVPSDGWWVIDLSGRLRGTLRQTEDLSLAINVDGKSLANQTIHFTNGQPASLKFTTPYLSAGTHTIGVNIGNEIGRRTFQVLALAVCGPGGFDGDNNGRPDWLDAMLSAGNQLSPVASESPVSPFFVEGSVRHFGGASVQAAGQTVAVQRGLGDLHWFADVPLSEGGATSVGVSFENQQQVVSVTWNRWNAMSGQNLTIRVGDSVKIGGWLSPVDQGNVSITVNGLTHTIAASGYFVMPFTQPGTFPVTVSHVGGDQTSTTITVVAASFGNPGVFYADVLTWRSFPDVPTSLEITADPSMRVDATEAEGGGQRVLLRPFSGGNHVLAARISNGPIVALGNVTTLAVSDALRNDAAVYIGSTADGYRILRTPIVVTDLPEGGRVVITIFRAGVTFMDGTIVKTLTGADFVEGVAYLDFRYPADMSGGYCHYIDVYDAENRHLGRR